MLPAPKAPLAVAVDFLGRGDVWARTGLCFLAATILWVVMSGWAPAFPYRVRESPLRDLHAHTTFEYKDLKKTEENRDRIRRTFLCYYSNDSQLLEQMRLALIADVFEIKEKTFEEAIEAGLWNKFLPPPVAEAIAVPATLDDEPIDEQAAEEAAKLAAEKQSLTQQKSYDAFREALSKDEKLEALKSIVSKAFLEIDQNGLLQNLEHEIGTGSIQEIEVYPKGDLLNKHRVAVSKVRIAEASVDLRARLQDELKKESETIPDTELVADKIFQWLKPKLPVTLSYDAINTRRAVDAALKAVKFEMRTYQPGEKLEQVGQDRELKGIQAGQPLDENAIKLLQAEHTAQIASEGYGMKALRTLLFFGLFAAVFSMVVQYLYYRNRELLDDLRQFIILLTLMTLTLTIAWLLAMQPEWRAEIIPIMIFSITIAITYHIELAIILSALVALAFSVAHGYGMAEFVILTAASSTSALMCKRIRSRTKLVNLGAVVAAIVFPTVIGVNHMLGQPLEIPLLTDATWFAGGAGIGGLMMTAMLPFLERLFDIQTDISLLELSDANHPLLKELVQRAPGTYNHSINVASISEAAAESIGANGLLCRVGAYFHDVGKLRKPEYFIENQSGGINKHDDLVPTMSTLVIIAHVKDGADLARKHRLPRRIIDLIEQHHGTTLVEYFFHRAEKQQTEKRVDDNDTVIDEADFRYPGPKPQTAEAAVLMLADTIESASRALREPGPSRIKGLVQEIAQKKLDDGQFDQCPITIEQLKTIQDSLVKSLNAMYHARVKYPEKQATA